MIEQHITDSKTGGTPGMAYPGSLVSICPLRGTSPSLFIVGPSGVGKTKHVLMAVLERLARGHPVTIIECGRTYIQACRDVGGSYLTSQGGSNTQVQRFGGTPLRIYDVEHLRPAETLFEIDPTSGGLLVVDEVTHVQSRYTGLRALLERHVKEGGTLCIVGQCERDVASYFGLSSNELLITLSRPLNRSASKTATATLESSSA
jgi:hypothetical protein